MTRSFNDVLHKMGTSATMRSTVSKVTIIPCSLSVEKHFSQNSICIVSCFCKLCYVNIVYSKVWSNKVIKKYPLLLTFCSRVHVFVHMLEYLCVCVSSCKMRGGRTFLSVAPCLHCPTVTEITGCSRTDCSWILNWSFWLLWIKNSLCHKSCKRVPWWIACRDCHAKWHTGYSSVRAG